MTGQFTEDDAKVSSGRPARSRDDSISAKQGESDIEYVEQSALSRPGNDVMPTKWSNKCQM